MARRKQKFVKGTFAHRHTESDYVAVLLEAVPPEEWREVVNAALEFAKNGDAGARAWLAQYLMGKPSVTAPAPLEVVVDRLAGRDPVAEKLAKPEIERARYPSLHAGDAFEESVRALAAEELRELDSKNRHTPNASETKFGQGVTRD